MCGFNQKMLNGLKEFNEGLFEHGIIERAKRKNSSVESIVNAEVSDMEKFLAETQNLSNPEFRQVIEGLTLYAQGVYGLAGKEKLSEYKKIVNELNALFFKMGHKYYSELEGKPDSMKKLVDYLNSQNSKHC